MNSTDLTDLLRKGTSPVGQLLLQAYKWLVVIPVLLISTLVIGSLVIVLSVLGFADFSSRVFGTLWARLNTLVTLMSIEVEGKDNISKGQSYVIVANHQSLLDIYALYGFTGLDMKWVMKKELRAVPVLGAACEAMGHIIIDRSNTEAAIHSINNAREKIRDGMSVVFFPEGTRSRNGELNSFKKGAFRFACEIGVPVLPISIHDTRHILPSDTLDWQPGHAKMIIHQPIPAGSETDAEQLCRQSRDVIARALSG